MHNFLLDHEVSAEANGKKKEVHQRNEQHIIHHTALNNQFDGVMQMHTLNLTHSI